MDEKSSATHSILKGEGSREEKSEKKIGIIEKQEQFDLKLQLSADEMRKKQQKKDEDPRITKFKNTEVKNNLKIKNVY
jgi:hypothetical protein